MKGSLCEQPPFGCRMPANVLTMKSRTGRDFLNSNEDEHAIFSLVRCLPAAGNMSSCKPDPQANQLPSRLIVAACAMTRRLLIVSALEPLPF